MHTLLNFKRATTRIAQPRLTGVNGTTLSALFEWQLWMDTLQAITKNRARVP